MFGSLVYDLMLMEALAKAALGDGPANPCANAQDVAEKERDAFDARQDRDRAWIERELGDVQVVARRRRPVYNISASLRAAAAIATLDALACGTGGTKVGEDGTILPIDPYAMHIPVESLGRDE